MGREIRRVPLDFDWPLEKTWEGFLNPHGKPCPAAADNLCHHGETPAAQWLMAIARLLALIGDEAAAEPQQEELRARGRLFPHPYLTEWGQAPRCEMPADVRERIAAMTSSRDRVHASLAFERDNPPKLAPFTPQLAELMQKLCGEGYRPSPFSDNSYEFYRSLLRFAGVDPATWGHCKVCGGEGIDPAVKETHDAWTPTAPPEGPGWQVWETVSEGSPISPVFGTKEELIAYLVETGYSQIAAEKFCDAGWVPSAMGQTRPDGSTDFRADIEAATFFKDKDKADAEEGDRP